MVHVEDVVARGTPVSVLQVIIIGQVGFTETGRGKRCKAAGRFGKCGY